MSLQFVAPDSGTKVKVTMRIKNDFIFRKSDFEDQVYEGTVVKNFPWQQPNTFALTGDIGIPIRVIELKDVSELKTADGVVGSKEVVDNSSRTIEVKGSKGDTYLVSVNGNKKSCSCPGFTFRGKCRHLEQLK